MVDSPVLKFTFFQKDRTNFYERTEWNKFTDATELKNSLKQKKAVLPIFTNIPDGRDLGSPCVQGDGYELRLLRHLWTFLTVSLDYIGRGFRRGGRDDDHLGIG